MLNLAQQQRWLLERSSSGSWTSSSPGTPSKGVTKALLVANFIETNLLVASKDGRIVPMRLNEAQSILHQFVTRCWHERVRVLVIVPKARQEGVSTYVQALNFALAVLSDRAGRAFRAATVAHIEESAKAIFGMSRRFQKLLPNEWKQDLESKQQGRIEWAGGSAIDVASIKLGDALLKGVTLNAFHGSEVANWADLGVNASEAFTSAMGALAPGPDSMIFLESTAKGRDAFFFRQIDLALRGKSPLRVVFLPWMLASEYRMTWAEYRAQRAHQELPETFEPTGEELELREYLSQVIVRPGEEWVRYRVELTDEQLIWRRHAIETLCDNKLETFKRYFPSTIEECFASTEKGMFTESTLEYLWQESQEPKWIGDLTLNPRAEVEFVPGGGRDAYLQVWEKPKAGERYILAADVAGEEDGDYSDATVIHEPTLTEVAAFSGHIDYDRFALYLYQLGRWYGWAKLAIENNHSPSVVLAVRKLGYPRLYYYTDPDLRDARPSRPGFNTNKKSRKIALAQLSAVCRDRVYRTRSKLFAEQAGWFVWNDRERRYKAAPGKHDDAVMSRAIAVFVAGVRGADGRRLAQRPGEQKDEAAYRAFLREQEEQERRNELVQGPIFL